IDGLEVVLDHGLTTLAIGLLDALFDLSNRLLLRQNAADGEETGLHHGVDASTHPNTAGYLVGVNYVEMQPFVENLLLHFRWQMIPDLFRFIDAIEQEDTARGSILEHIKALQEGELVTGHEVSLTGTN